MNPYKSMNEYLYPCQAIKDSAPFKFTQAITRWDMHIPFCLSDVNPSDVVERKDNKKEIPEDLYKKHIYWVWSRKEDLISYLEEAKTCIVTSTKTLMDEYQLESLPIIHNGTRETMCRVAAAVAARLHSVDESHETIIVKEEHVLYAYGLIVQTLNLLQLKEHKANMEGKSKIDASELSSIISDLGDEQIKILRELTKGGMSSTALSEKLKVSDRTIKTYYVPLRDHNLIETKTGKGITLSPRGIALLKMLIRGEPL